MARHKGSLVFHRAGQYQTWPDAQPPRWTNRLTPRKNALSWPPRCHVQTLFVPGQERKRATTSLSTHAKLCFRSNYASLSLSLSIVRSSVHCVLVYPFTAVVFAALFSSLAHSLLASVRLLSTIFPLMMNSRRGNDWGKLRVILFRSCRNFFLENSFFLFSIGLKFLGFNYPWKMLKLNFV